MILNDAGRMVERVWVELPDQYAGVDVDACVIMPDHFHGIVVMNGSRGESCIRPVSENAAHQVQGEHQEQGEHKVRPYGTKAGSLGRFIQAFKSLTTNAYIRGVNERQWPPFAGRLWQRNYFERIIRNDAELVAIRQYIVTNPQRWGGQPQ